MNGSRQLIETLVASLNKGTWGSNVEVAVSPPAVYLDAVRQKLRSDIIVSAQNIYFEKSGAFTGEISAEMLLDLGIKWTLAGHSERRELFHETDEIVGKKTSFAIHSGLSVIACIGEKLAERESDKTTEVVFRQLKAIADQVKPEDWSKIVIAYEPVWAIGTGKVATPQQAQEVHEAIRGWLAKNVSASVAESTRIIYGGMIRI